MSALPLHASVRPPRTRRHAALRRVAIATLLAALPLAAACSERGASTEASLDSGDGAAAQDAAYSPHTRIAGSVAGKVSQEELAVREAPPPPPAAAPAPQDPSVQGSDPFGSGPVASAMLIRTGTASVEVQALDQAIAAVQGLATRFGGYVASSEIQTGRDQVRTATLELKVPSGRFDELLSGLAPLGKVEAVNTSSEDVGEEYTDLTARAENSRRLEERLVALLATRTGKLEEVLSVERELARVREQIERLEGRMRYLRSRAALSTLRLTLHEPLPIVGVPGDNPIADAFRQAWRNLVAVVAGLIAIAGGALPLAVVAVVVWILVRRFIPRRQPAPVVPPGAVGGD